VCTDMRRGSFAEKKFSRKRAALEALESIAMNPTKDSWICERKC